MYRHGLPIYSEGMAESMKALATKGVALLVLLLAGFLLFKIVVGVATGIIWTLLVIAGLVAAVWALSRLF